MIGYLGKGQVVCSIHTCGTSSTESLKNHGPNRSYRS